MRSIGACLGCACFGCGAVCGRRGGVRAGGVEPVLSGWAAGSAVMMLTGGIESEDGKNKSGRGVPGGTRVDVPASAGCAPGIPGIAATGGAFGAGPVAGTGHTAE